MAQVARAPQVAESEFVKKLPLVAATVSKVELLEYAIVLSETVPVVPNTGAQFLT